MFRAWRRARIADRATSAAPVAQERVVGTAEAVVRRAWAEELLRRRDRAEFSVHAAQEDCEAAYRCLAGAQRDGDPGRIGLAHAALERALHVVHVSTLDRDRVRQALGAELDLLARVARERVVPAPVAQLEQNRSVITAARRAALGPMAGRLRSDAEAAGRERRVPRWFGRLSLRRTVAVEQP
jgi:hypothetical protein